MSPKSASASSAKSGAVQFSLPTEPCGRRRDCEISKAGAAPGSVGNKSIAAVAGAACGEKRRGATFWLSLLVILPIVVVGGQRITARVSGGTQKSSSRIGWYVHSGQWLADIRTFASACQLLMEVDTATPSHDPSPGGQVVGNSDKQALTVSENQSSDETAVN